MARKITFASGKGGTGNTTIVTNVAISAAQNGKDICIIEADMSMANISILLGLEDEKATLHEVLSGEADVSETIRSGPNGVKIIPAGMSLHGVRKADSSGLESVVEKIPAENLLIDAPSGLGHDTLISLRIGEELVFVLTPEITSLSDGLRVKNVAERLGKKTLGVVVVKTYDEKYDVPNEDIESMLEAPILATIPEDSEIRRSAAYGEPIVIRSPDSPSAKALRKLSHKLFD